MHVHDGSHDMSSDVGEAVVFIHGFKSHPGTWRKLEDLMKLDPDLQLYQRLRFQYKTGFTNPKVAQSNPDLDNMAEGLRTFLSSHCANKKVVLVCHSEGGLVAIRYLAKMVSRGQGHELQRIRRVILLATPNAGSKYLLMLRTATGPLLGRQEKELRPVDPFVAEAERTVIRQVVHAKDVTNSTCPIPISAYAGDVDKVVPIASAYGNFLETGVIPGSHFTIHAPNSRNDMSYVVIKQNIQKAFTNKFELTQEGHGNLPSKVDEDGALREAPMITTPPPPHTGTSPLSPPEFPKKAEEPLRWPEPEDESFRWDSTSSAAPGLKLYENGRPALEPNVQYVLSGLVWPGVPKKRQIQVSVIGELRSYCEPKIDNFVCDDEHEFFISINISSSSPRAGTVTLTVLARDVGSGYETKVHKKLVVNPQKRITAWQLDDADDRSAGLQIVNQGNVPIEASMSCEARGADYLVYPRHQIPIVNESTRRDAGPKSFNIGYKGECPVSIEMNRISIWLIRRRYSNGTLTVYEGMTSWRFPVSIPVPRRVRAAAVSRLIILMSVLLGFLFLVLGMGQAWMLPALLATIFLGLLFAGVVRARAG